MEFLKGEGMARKAQFLRARRQSSGCFARAVGIGTIPLEQPGRTSASVADLLPDAQRSAEAAPEAECRKPPPKIAGPSTARPQGGRIATPAVPVEVVVGDTELDSPNLGLMGDSRTTAGPRRLVRQAAVHGPAGLHGLGQVLCPGRPDREAP